MGHWTPTGIEPADYDDDDDDDDSQTFAAIPAHCWVTSEQNGTVLGACQPSTSSAGSSASSVVSTCQLSTSSAGSSASSVNFTRQPSTSSAPASKRSSSATPTASEIDDLFKIKSQCQLVPYKSDQFKALLWRTLYHSQIVPDYTYTKIVISELS